jgi:CubicO group peptidase (beta-lactamase class C family)
MGRTPETRFTSWSMAKSVTSLLLGICIDRGLIKSFDDPAERYVPELQGTLHGSTTLRNLANMSSGAEVLHDRDNPSIYPMAFMSRQSSITRTVAAWNQRKEEQGRTYNYNELCPLTLGMVIRKVTGMSLSTFAETALWQPMGAEADATWLTDSERNEFNCIGLAARLRDWARIGLLVADRGLVGGRQIVSEAWIRECTHWTEKDKQGRVGYAMRHAGYKALMWHAKSDGSWLYFNGHHGQRVIIDMASKTVLVQTAVDHEGNWQEELFAMFNAATKVQS